MTNPSPALLFTPADPATLVAMLVLYLSLAVVSAVVHVLRPLAEPTGSGHSHALRHQVNAWWRLFPFVSVAWLAHPWGAWLLLMLLGLLAGWELDRHRLRTARLRSRLVCAGLLVWQLGVAGWGAAEQSWALAGLPLACLVLAVRYLRSHHTDDLLTLVFALACAGLVFTACLPQLPGEPGSDAAAWFFFLMAVTALNDIAQFVSGKLFGKQKIARRISPNKTWQGLMGGMLVSAVVAWALGRWLGLAPTPYLVVLGLALSVAGFAGDLMFSAAKRRLGVKDFSTLLPGHGGILDRVDSLVLTAPLLYLALRWAPPGAVP